MKRCVSQEHYLHVEQREQVREREVHAMGNRMGTLTFVRGRGPRAERQFFTFSNSVRQAGKTAGAMTFRCNIRTTMTGMIQVNS